MPRQATAALQPRKRFIEEGLETALRERPRPGVVESWRQPEALRIALVCHTPPEARHCWTRQLLADKLVEL